MQRGFNFDTKYRMIYKKPLGLITPNKPSSMLLGQLLIWRQMQIWIIPNRGSYAVVN